MIKVNGAEIFVEHYSGTGNSNFVLIHNAGADHRFFKHQVEMLKAFGNVVLLDLPGCGKSQSITRYKMQDLSSVIAAVCKKLALKNICLVGLNNGANIAIDTTLNHPLAIDKLVLIDPPIFMDSSFIAEIHAYIESLESAKFDRQYVLALVEALFLDAAEETREIAINAFNGADKTALPAIFRGLLEWDAHSQGVLKNILCPTLCILTDGHHCSYEKMHREAPHFEIGKVVGSKCWATLEVPEQINAMIARFLTLTRF